MSLGGSVKAQIVLTTADTIRASGNASQFEIVGYGGVVNQGASSVQLRWLRVGSQLPSTWTHTICDLNSCYPPFVDSADFTLTPRDTSNLDGHFYLNGQAGAGYQRIRLSTLPANAPLMVVTFIASTASSTTQTLISAPNKAAWKLVGRELLLATEGLEAKAMVRVVDQSGREVYGIRRTLADGPMAQRGLRGDSWERIRYGTIPIHPQSVDSTRAIFQPTSTTEGRGLKRMFCITRKV